MFYHLLPDLSDAELRTLDLRHAEVLLALIEANRAYLRMWLPCLDELRTRADVETFITEAGEQSAADCGLIAGVWFQGDLAGMVGFNAIDPINRSAEIGYWLGAVFQGRGLMTSAVRLLVEHAFGMMRLHRLVILCAVGNTRSTAVARRLGFTYEGVIREAELLDDRFVDDEVYAMLAPAWREAHVGMPAALHV